MFSSILDISFLNPELLYLLLIIPFLVFWHIRKYRHTYPRLQFSHILFSQGIKKSFRQRLWFISPVFRYLAFALMILAFARPVSSMKNSEENIEGIDIVVTLDISSSMLAEDFRPNRLEAAKSVASDFIKGRTNDRIAIVAFSGEAYTQCPLTIDHDVLLSQTAALKCGLIEDGTAIGDGLAVAVNRLKESKAVSKTIILLTDGVNNMGAVNPLNAAEMAKLFNIRLYTIGVGSMGEAPYPFQTPFGIQYQNIKVDIDEKLLTEMSELTGGRYFRATSKNKLETIFKEIDQLEKTKIEVLSFEQRSEEFKSFLILALAVLLLDLCLHLFIFKFIP